VITAMLTSSAMIGYQMAAKATRDALFLSSFDVTALPAMVMTSAVLSVLFAFAASRIMTSVGPARLIPVLFASSAVLLLVEWGLLEQYRRPIAVIVYLHYGALGALLVSGFWSIVNERFDPRTAKRQVSRIAAGATVGGLLGGLLAERVAAMLSMPTMLPILAGLHLFCAWMVLRLGLGTKSHTVPDQERKATTDDRQRSGLKIIAQTPYLRNLVAFVLLATTAEVFIDFVFKARASMAFGDGEDLLRLFAVFYTGIALFTVVVQSTLGRLALQRLGLARTVALLPTVLTVGGVGALAVPGLISAAIARGAEAVLRNSLYRPAYELLFSPIGQRQKRATKTIVDVGFVRFGDVIGAAIVQLTLLLAVGTGISVLLGLTAGFSVLAVLVAIQLHRGYVQTLEKSLVSRAAQLDLDDLDEAATRTIMLQTVGTLGLAPSSPVVDSAQGYSGDTASAQAGAVSEPAIPVTDPVIVRITELRSRDAERVLRALISAPLTPTMAPHVVPLLAWDDVATTAMKTLRDISPNITGLLLDRLLDEDEEFSVRRRIPLVLAACPTTRAFEGIFMGLRDKRFEVRYHCGRALSKLQELNTDLRIDRERVVAAVLREVAVGRGVWESHRLIDKMEDEAWSPVLDEVLGDRANRSLEHVFTILALLLPRQPLKIAFRGLHTDDAVLRGTALEYLETALPPEVRSQLWPFLDDAGRKVDKRRSSAQILESLLESNMSIAINLDEIKRKSEGQMRGPVTDEGNS